MEAFAEAMAALSIVFSILDGTANPRAISWSDYARVASAVMPIDRARAH
jgi:hypothetical protein